MSIGLYHWAASGAAAAEAPRLEELGGLTAYLEFRDQAESTHAAGVFTQNGWNTSAKLDRKIGKHLQSPDGKLTYVTELGLTDDRGGVRHATPDEITEYLPSWRSFYRQIVAGRTNDDLARGFYGMAKRRLRDLYRLTFPPTCRPTDARQHPKSGPDIGTVFTSEVLVAQVLRWHVNWPTAVVSSSHENAIPSNALQEAYRAASVEVAKQKRSQRNGLKS